MQLSKTNNREQLRLYAQAKLHDNYWQHLMPVLWKAGTGQTFLSDRQTMKQVKSQFNFWLKEHTLQLIWMIHRPRDMSQPFNNIKASERHRSWFQVAVLLNFHVCSLTPSALVPKLQLKDYIKLLTLQNFLLVRILLIILFLCQHAC